MSSLHQSPSSEDPSASADEVGSRWTASLLLESNVAGRDELPGYSPLLLDEVTGMPDAERRGGAERTKQQRRSDGGGKVKPAGWFFCPRNWNWRGPPFPGMTDREQGERGMDTPTGVGDDENDTKRGERRWENEPAGAVSAVLAERGGCRCRYMDNSGGTAGLDGGGGVRVGEQRMVSLLQAMRRLEAHGVQSLSERQVNALIAEGTTSTKADDAVGAVGAVGDNDQIKSRTQVTGISSTAASVADRSAPPPTCAGEPESCDNNLAPATNESCESSRDGSSELLDSKGDGLRLRNLCLRIKACNSPTDSECWDDVRRCLDGMASDAEKALLAAQAMDRHFATPLHIVCARNPPADIVRRVLDAAPMVARWPDECGLLPVHVACLHGASADVFELLHDSYPQSKLVLDDLGRSPLHLVCRNTNRGLPDPAVLRVVVDRTLLTQPDQNGRTPVRSFAARARKISSAETSEVGRAQEDLNVLLDAEPEGTWEFLRALQNLPGPLRNAAVVHRHTRRTLNTIIAQQNATNTIMISFVNRVLAVTFFALAVRDFIKTPDKDDSWTSTLVVYAICCISANLIGGISLARSKALRAYVYDVWNWLDVCGSVLLFVSAQKMDSDTAATGEGIRALLIVTGVLLWIALWHLLMISRLEFSVFASGVVHVTKNLIPFIVATCFVLLAFAQMYFIDTGLMALDSGGTVNACDINSGEQLTSCSMVEALVTMWVMLVSGVGEDAFYGDGATPLISTLFSLVAIVILLNILIAICTNLYDRLEEKREEIFWSHRFNYLFQIEPFVRAEANAHYWLYRNVTCGRKRQRTESDMRDQRAFRLRFDSLCLEFRDPREVAVREAKERTRQELEQMQCSAWYLCDPWNTKPSWLKRVLSASFILLWIVIGLVSCGYLWPPQVREFLLCPPIEPSKIEHDAAKTEEESAPRVVAPAEVVGPSGDRFQEELQSFKIDLMAAFRAEIKRSAEESATNMLRALEKRTNSGMGEETDNETGS